MVLETFMSCDVQTIGTHLIMSQVLFFGINAVKLTILVILPINLGTPEPGNLVRGASIKDVLLIHERKGLERVDIYCYFHGSSFVKPG